MEVTDIALRAPLLGAAANKTCKRDLVERYFSGRLSAIMWISILLQRSHNRNLRLNFDQARPSRSPVSSLHLTRCNQRPLHEFQMCICEVSQMLRSPDGSPLLSADGGMNIKQTAQRSHDFETRADEALQPARDMPPGSERIEALKAAGMLRNAADVFGVIFAKRGRPSKGIAPARGMVSCDTTKIWSFFRLHISKNEPPLASGKPSNFLRARHTGTP
jgi:hypothetical protein